MNENQKDFEKNKQLVTAFAKLMPEEMILQALYDNIGFLLKDPKNEYARKMVYGGCQAILHKHMLNMKK